MHVLMLLIVVLTAAQSADVSDLLVEIPSDPYGGVKEVD